MNGLRNSTAAARPPAPVATLVANHISAIAEYDRLFQLKDWGLIENVTASAALPPIDDAIMAICRARPSTGSEIELRRSYLLAVLPDYVDDDKARVNSVLEALLDIAV